MVILQRRYIMASEAVKQILNAEAEADKRSSEARVKAEEIVSDAEKNSSIAIQKRLTDAKTELSKLKNQNAAKLEDYKRKAEAKCSEKLSGITSSAKANTDKAVEAIINGYFS